MILSMTGFGKASGECNGYRIEVEIRSLNSKFLDLNLRIPSGSRALESVFREHCQQQLERGKVELSLNVEGDKSQEQARVHPERFANYLKELSQLCEKHNLPQDQLLPLAIRMPGVVVESESSMPDTVAQACVETVDRALKMLNEHRKAEGASLSRDLKEQIECIGDRLAQVEPFESARNQAYRERLEKNMSASGLSVDPARFHQEVLYVLERWDINEEKKRLRYHLDYFLEQIETDRPQGRKLGFIAQEIGREINTLGSKCNQSDIQRRVVEMKEALEKIKEQLNNAL